jgi:hypothetical protein
MAAGAVVVKRHSTNDTHDCDASGALESLLAPIVGQALGQPVAERAPRAADR